MTVDLELEELNFLMPLVTENMCNKQRANGEPTPFEAGVFRKLALDAMIPIINEMFNLVGEEGINQLWSDEQHPLTQAVRILFTAHVQIKHGCFEGEQVTRWPEWPRERKLNISRKKG